MQVILGSSQQVKTQKADRIGQPYYFVVEDKAIVIIQIQYCPLTQRWREDSMAFN